MAKSCVVHAAVKGPRAILVTFASAALKRRWHRDTKGAVFALHVAFITAACNAAPSAFFTAHAAIADSWAGIVTGPTVGRALVIDELPCY